MEGRECHEGKVVAETENTVLDAASSQRSGAARFGNFPDYYKFNPIENRTRYIPENFLEQLDLSSQKRIAVLDVGCNTGDLTVALVKKLRSGLSRESVDKPTFDVLGVDIDSDLIARAEQATNVLQHEDKTIFTFRAGNLLEATCVEELHAFVRTSTESEECSKSSDIEAPSSRKERVESSSSGSQSRCRNQRCNIADPVPSESANIIEAIESPSIAVAESSNHDRRPRFDIVFAFGVTMWIHLNNGDSELFRFLETLASLGKYVVLEPQPWKCYKAARKRARRLGAASFPMYDSLSIRSSGVETEIHNFLTREATTSRSCEHAKDTATAANHDDDNKGSEEMKWWSRSGCGMRYSLLLGETKWGRDVRVYSRVPLTSK